MDFSSYLAESKENLLTQIPFGSWERGWGKFKIELNSCKRPPKMSRCGRLREVVVHQRSDHRGLKFEP